MTSASSAAIPCPWALAAQRWPDRPAFVSGAGEPLTWAALDALIRSAQQTIRVQDSPVLGYVVEHTKQDVVVLVASLREGRDLMLFGRRAPQAEVTRFCSEQDAFLIEDVEFNGETANAPGESSLATNKRTVLTGTTRIRTSGSTGRATWVRHSAEAHMASARAVVGRLGLAPEDRWGWCLPSNHVGGLSILWRCALSGAVTVAMPTDTAIREWLRTVPTEFHPTILSLVPTQLRDVLSTPALPASSLQSVIVGGAALSPSLMARALSAGWPIRTTYGMTETASMVTLSEVWTASASSIHVGTPLAHAALTSRSGRVHVQSNALGDSLADAEGWMATSDRGGERSDGRWIISGRLDRVIISGGENLDPSRIESAILVLPPVEGVRVVGIPDIRYGERPVAFIESDAHLPDRAWFTQALAPALASFEIPDDFLPMPSPDEGDAKATIARLVQIAIEHRTKAER